MNEKDIIENNKILAEFLCTTQKTEGIDDCYIYSGMACHIDDLNFHKDWNWLMEVVEKIESSGNDVLITSNYIQIAYKDGEEFIVIELKGNIKIEAVYTACIEFVKWYNLKSK